jgi:hypothetical protein
VQVKKNKINQIKIDIKYDRIKGCVPEEYNENTNIGENKFEQKRHCKHTQAIQNKQRPLKDT